MDSILVGVAASVNTSDEHTSGDTRDPAGRPASVRIAPVLARAGLPRSNSGIYNGARLTNPKRGARELAPVGPIGDTANMGHADIALIGSALVAQALKEIGIPAPGVTQGALVYAGYQLAGGQVLTGSIIVTAVYAGSLCGALMAYAIGRSLGVGLVNRPGRYLHLSARNLEWARDRLGRGVLRAVTLGRMIPAIKAPLSVVAGMTRVPVAVFAGGVSLSTLAWAGLLAGLGAVCGRVLDDLALPANVPFLAAVTGGTILAASLASLWWRSTQDVGGDGMGAR